jgi:hypothetical protein
MRGPPLFASASNCARTGAAMNRRIAAAIGIRMGYGTATGLRDDSIRADLILP